MPPWRDVALAGWNFFMIVLTVGMLTSVTVSFLKLIWKDIRGRKDEGGD